MHMLSTIIPRRLPSQCSVFRLQSFNSGNRLATTVALMTLSAPNPPEMGDYVPAKPTDLRSPCPMINCLANHGYLPRDGRTVHAKDFIQAMSEVGVSPTLAAVFTHPIFLEHAKQSENQVQEQLSLYQKLKYLLHNPWAIMFSELGMWNTHQRDAVGEKYLDLDQLSQPGIMEHDVSLTRLDHSQGDNATLQPKLVNELLASSSDGGRTLTDGDLAAFRLRRIQQQRRDNPSVLYGPRQHDIACLSIATILQIFGDGRTVPCEFVRVFFLEERLPISEGWRKRQWWKLGLVELGWGIGKIKSIIGLKF